MKFNTREDIEARLVELSLKHNKDYISSGKHFCGRLGGWSDRTDDGRLQLRKDKHRFFAVVIRLPIRPLTTTVGFC